MPKNEVWELKNILTDFIVEQKQFNNEQREFNKRIEEKVDKSQYFLEETIAQNTKMFFEEQTRMKKRLRKVEDKTSELENDTLDLSSQIKVLQRA